MSDLPEAAAPTSPPEARIEAPDDRTVNYVFPVKIVLVGALTDRDLDAIDKRIWSGFADAMQNA